LLGIFSIGVAQAQNSVSQDHANNLSSPAQTLLLAQQEGAPAVQVPPETPASSTKEEPTLPTVTVTGESERDPTSEGSGSYAARAATIGKGGARSLREIPQTVSVVTRQQIEDQGLQSVSEALNQTPGLYAIGGNSLTGGELSSGSGYRSRGFEMGYSIDGMTAGSSTAHSTLQLDDLSLVDRVEVLRGPAALLRGASDSNSFGGSVNVVRKKPLPEFGLSTSVSAGSWANYRGMVDVTGPLNESTSVRGRLVLTAGDRDFFYGTKSHNRNWTGYGVLEIDLTPRTIWSFSATRSESRTDQPYTGITHYYGGKPAMTDRSFNINKEQSYSNLENTVMATELVHRFENEWKIEGKLSYQEYHRQGESFYSLGPIDPVTKIDDFFHQMRNDFDGETWSYDLNVSGPFKLFGQTHRLTLGMDGSRYHYWLGTSANPRINDPSVDVFDPSQRFPALEKDPNLRDRIYPQQAYYGVGHFKLADPLTLIVGVRVSSFEYRERRIGMTDWATSLKETGEVTPYGGLIWDWNKQISLYASYAEIFVPQSATNYEEKVLPPRVGWQGEIGVKGEFLDGRLNTLLALYRLRDTNRPITDPDHFGCDAGDPTSGCIMAAGLVQSQGIDVEISGSPLRGLQLMAGYTYSENEYLRDSDAANVGKNADNLMPRHIFKLWGNYRFAANDFGGLLKGWRVGLGLVAQSSTYVDSYRLGNISNPGRAIANAQIGWQIAPKTALDLSINNLFDKRYLEEHSYMTYSAYGEPRSFLLTLRHQF
jgi:outer membrane receptor for ferric coprogen and ferric-rhodotorulic acid